jgi:biotin synthase
MRGHRPQFFVASCRALLQETKPQSLVRKYGTVSSVSAGPTPQSAVFDRALEANAPRNNWTKEEIKEIYDTPLMKLAFAAVCHFPLEVSSTC